MPLGSSVANKVRVEVVLLGPLSTAYCEITYSQKVATTLKLLSQPAKDRPLRNTVVHGPASRSSYMTVCSTK